MERSKNIIVILFCLNICSNIQMYSRTENIYQSNDSIYYPGLEQYLDMYYDYYYDYPGNLSELISFIEYYNDNEITLESYHGRDLLYVTLPKINAFKNRLSSYSTDSCFSLLLDEEILILNMTPRSGTPCKYLGLIEKGFYDKRSTVYEYGILFFDSNMRPVIRGVEELTSSFYDLKMNALEKYSKLLISVSYKDGTPKRLFYKFEKAIGLMPICSNCSQCIENDFYHEFAKELDIFLDQNKLNKIVFCMGVYNM